MLFGNQYVPRTSGWDIRADGGLPYETEMLGFVILSFLAVGIVFFIFDSLS